jgi:hypothetical protein
MSHILRGGSASRVVYELIVECERFGNKQVNGSYNLFMHEDELARRAGLSRETVS